MSLVATRERRANAGARMRELIEKEMELEDMFKEVPEDDDFMVTKEEEDFFDSDFDQNSSGPEDNDDTAELQILLEERLEKKRSKKSNLPFLSPALRLKKKETDKVPVVSETIPDQNVNGESPNIISDKKKKSSNTTPLLHGVRSSSRSLTVQSKQMLAEKLKEYEKKKAAHPKREKVIVHRKTQEELLAEAKETEEKNLASLRAFELREAEKKKSVKQSKKVVMNGPFIREISYVVGDNREAKRPKLIEESVDEQEKSNITDSNNLDCTMNNVEFENQNQDKREVRNLLIFSQFSKVEEAKLFQEWKKKPQRAKKVLCPFTGLIAKYKDSKTGIPYANVEAYSRIQKLLQHKYIWSETHSAYINDVNQKPAEGTPDGFQAV
ncbi:Vacuolar protein sorting-associated protein 72 [Gigaspora margarita]|uniref:Vacuolar protein sorting-associated protein 72 n=1 Tax=Gigaspora margarita TaxID=4874 RepID=A0A8H4A882_GIGMA|nr:Vacuolar protein sorting-associated protein 72 [Gigaspora margarita]